MHGDWGHTFSLLLIFFCFAQFVARNKIACILKCNFAPRTLKGKIYRACVHSVLNLDIMVARPGQRGMRKERCALKKVDYCTKVCSSQKSVQ